MLIAPEVPWNTGNIGRTCLGAGAGLHLIQPLGFSLASRDLKRAGLDYWHQVQLRVWDDFEAFERQMAPQQGQVALLTKNGRRPFWEMPVCARLFLLFGSETHGIPAEILARFPDATYHIPIRPAIRCLNLSTTVGIALYQSLRR